MYPCRYDSRMTYLSAITLCQNFELQALSNIPIIRFERHQASGITTTQQPTFHIFHTLKKEMKRLIVLVVAVFQQQHLWLADAFLPAFRSPSTSTRTTKIPFHLHMSQQQDQHQHQQQQQQQAPRLPKIPTPPQPTTQQSPSSKKSKRMTLRRYLNNVVMADPTHRDMESLSLSIQMACKTISNLVTRAGINSLSTPPAYINDQNEGEERDQGLIQYDYRMNSMKRLDELSTTVLRNALRFTGKLHSVKKAKDEEDFDRKGELLVQEHQPGVLIASALDSKYVAYFDPLDGSGNADAAICTGTVFGIFETEDGEYIVESEDVDSSSTRSSGEDDNDNDTDGVDNVVLGGGDGMEDGSDKMQDVMENYVLQPGKKLVAAGYCLYSSATILVFTLGDGTHGFTLDPQCNEFVLTHPNIKIPPRGNVYSCNEANSEGWSEDVLKYLHALKSGENETKERYALRYVGSLVGDIHRTLMYGGIFFYPGDSCLYPNGHLQLLYKSAPLGYVIEQAGGMSTNGKVNLMDVRPTRVHERSPCFIGSPEDINEMKKYIQHDE